MEGEQRKRDGEASEQKVLQAFSHPRTATHDKPSVRCCEDSLHAVLQALGGISDTESYGQRCAVGRLKAPLLRRLRWPLRPPLRRRPAGRLAAGQPRQPLRQVGGWLPSGGGACCCLRRRRRWRQHMHIAFMLGPACRLPARCG